MKLAKKLILILLLVSIISAMFSFGASAAGTIAWGAANSAGNSVRVRSGPGLEHSVLAHANRGEPFVILERTNDEWYMVNYSGTVGYVSVPLLERPRTVANFEANGRVEGSGVNMRETPSTSGNSLGTYSRGTVMNIIGINEGWYKVRFDNKTGYIRSDFMNVISPGGGASTLSAGSAAITGTITGSRVNMRTAPNLGSTILGTYARGTSMEVLGIDNGWYSVRFNGLSGFISSDFMQVSSPPPAINSSPASTPANTSSSYVAPSGPAPAYNAALGQQIASLATGFVGSRYVPGGSSPSGFDCSGFTFYIYRQFGINLTRNSSGQYRDNGTHINKSDLAPGDLVFTSSNGHSVTHVGIYIGDNRMVHASTPSTGVIISSLNSANYLRTFFGAKRVI